MKLVIENLTGSGFVAEPCFIKKPKDGDHRGDMFTFDQKAEIEIKNGELRHFGIAAERDDFRFELLINVMRCIGDVMVNNLRVNVGDRLEFPLGEAPKIRVSCVK